MSHLTSKFRSTPTITFKGRYSQKTKILKVQVQPSPQLYNIDHFTIGKNIKKSVKFSKEKRSPSLNFRRELPGPGTYEPKSVKELVSFHKGEVLKTGPQRFENKKNNESPAPGYYPLLEKRYSSPMFSIGKVKRSLKELTGVNSTPSPGNYNPKYNSQEQSMSISFGHSKRKNQAKKEKIPGPGSYETEKPFLSTSFNQKKSIMPKARRNSTSSLEILPGPGSYRSSSLFSEDRIKKIGFTWKKEPKNQSSGAETTPGPGQYESQIHLLRFKRHQGVSMAKSERIFPKSNRFISSPGPGDHESFYEGESKFKNINASKFAKSKTPRFPKPEQNHFDFINPEKLNYRKASAPSFSISQTKKKALFEEELKKGLPDKFYDSNIEKIKKTDPKFKIPKAENRNIIEKSDIGPGYYNTQQNSFPLKKMKFSKERRFSFIDQMVKSKLNTFKGETYESRQQFPNPPKYMNVYKKLSVNEKKMRAH